MRICDLMHKGVISCLADDSVYDVARMMDDNHSSFGRCGQ